MDSTSLGARIKEMRERQGHTLESLGEVTGISHPMLSQIETGNRTPSLKNLIIIAKALGTTPNFLLDWDFAWFESLNDDVKNFLSDKDHKKWVELAINLKRSGLSPEAIGTALAAFAQSVYDLKKSDPIISTGSNNSRQDK